MTTQNELLLEHRVSELELELHRLKRQLERLTPTQPAPAQQTKSYQPPAERTVIHERRRYDFFAKLPDVMRVIDYRATNHASGETVCFDGYSVAQITYAIQKFSRLQFISRKHWKGDKRLYSVALKLFANAGAIERYAHSRVWHWGKTWPHMRPFHAAKIIASLSAKTP